MILSALGTRVCNLCENVLIRQVRHAGHNKWSNIKHIKAAKDLQNSKLASQFSHRIRVCVKDHGGDANPETNAKLKKIMAEAASANVPKSSLQAALKNKPDDRSEFQFEVGLPGGISLFVETLCSTRNGAINVLNGVLKKKGGSLETRLKTKFDKKGIIIVEVQDQNLEYLEEMAIEAGAEEVDLNTEEKMAEFTTDVNDFPNVKEFIEGKGFKCVDATISYLPEFPADPSNVERKVAENLKEILEGLDIVMAVHRNY
eukprot:TRINITY_DN30066_c0_g1_i8.p1 TRINITY_DN30066_c0_g1~~TRINITY_DN30066_c0_g1_i8.p1  ORF type:complete len:258 (+),score=43.69 TRINITY_DN30066_c0_g1_i8:43-816(+)